jgi:hypothetical protein
MLAHLKDNREHMATMQSHGNHIYHKIGFAKERLLDDNVHRGKQIFINQKISISKYIIHS